MNYKDNIKITEQKADKILAAVSLILFIFIYIVGCLKLTFLEFTYYYGTNALAMSLICGCISYYFKKRRRKKEDSLLRRIPVFKSWSLNLCLIPVVAISIYLLVNVCESGDVSAYGTWFWLLGASSADSFAEIVLDYREEE